MFLNFRFRIFDIKKMHVYKVVLSQVEFSLKFSKEKNIALKGHIYFQ